MSHYQYLSTEHQWRRILRVSARAAGVRRQHGPVVHFELPARTGPPGLVRVLPDGLQRRSTWLGGEFFSAVHCFIKLTCTDNQLLPRSIDNRFYDCQKGQSQAVFLIKIFVSHFM